MRYAVTGGAGFIGNSLVRQLCADGHEVIVVDNFSRGRASNLKGIRGRISLVEMDIVDYVSLNDALSDLNGIFHLAALPSIPDSFVHEDKYRKANVTGTDNVFRIGLESRTKVVFASSSSVYGNVQTLPISEDSVRNPLSPYAATKYEGEILAEKYVDQGAQIVSLRYFNVIGLGRALKYAGVIPKFLDKIKKGEPPIIFGDGSLVRDFVDIDDVIRATIMAMESKTTRGFFNIGSGQPITIKGLARMMIDASGLIFEPEHTEPRCGDAKATLADISKAREEFGWIPTVSLEDSIHTLFKDDI